VSSFITGAACASVAVAIWAGWLVFMRIGVKTTFPSPIWQLYGSPLPGLFSFPSCCAAVWLSIGWASLGSLPWFSGGVPYVLIVGVGLSFAPVAHASVLTQGIVPLPVALVAAVVLKERLTSVQKLGLVLIISGGLVIGGVGAALLAAPRASVICAFLPPLFFLLLTR